MPMLDVELFVANSGVGVGAFCPVEPCAHWFCDGVLWTWSRCGTLAWLWKYWLNCCSVFVAFDGVDCLGLFVILGSW